MIHKAWICKHLAECFNIIAEEIVENKIGWQNIVYYINGSTGSFVLRMTPESNRSDQELTGELQWLTLLKGHLKVPQAILTKDNQLFAKVMVYGRSYFSSVFERLPGKHIDYPGYIQQQTLFFAIGKELGKLHNRSQDLNVSSLYRRHFFENQYLREFDEYVPTVMNDIRQAKDQLVSGLQEFGKEKSNYGLIHGDVHLNNLLINNNTVCLIDFDECQYSFFIEDIAISLYYSIYQLTNSQACQRKKLADVYLNYFLRGYRQEVSLHNRELAKLEFFLKLREIIAFVGAYKKWDFQDLSQWQQLYLKESYRRISNRESIVILK